MAGNPGTPFSVLPQFQGNLYDLQTKQALAQALMQKGLQGELDNYRPAGGGFAYVPTYGVGSAIGQLGQALLGGALQRQASEGLGQLGAQQAAAYQQMFSPTVETQQATVETPPTEQAPLSFGLSANGGFTAGAPDAGRAALGNALAPQITRTTQAPLNPMGMRPEAAGFLAQTMGLPEFAKAFVAPSYKPTDTTLMAQQAGMSPAEIQAANRGRIAKENFVAPTAGGPGVVYRNPFTNEVIGSNPNIGEGMQPVYDQSGRFVGTMPIQGYTNTVAAIEGAKAGARSGAEAEFKVEDVYDPNFVNPDGSRGAMVRQTVANQAAAARSPQNSPLGIRNNNPGNLRPGGSFAQYPDMQTGLTALDNNLQSYGKQGINTVAGVISKWAPPNENDTNSYIKEVSQRLGIKPDQKIDLTNPLVRQSISTAIALRENGPNGVFGAGGGGGTPQQAQGGPMLARAPFGAPEEATAGAQGRVATMNESYKGLRTARDSAQNAITLLDDMQKYGQDKNPVLANKLYNVANLYSTDAQLFDKARNNLIAQVSGSTGMGTDQARSIVEGSIPSYGMSQAAIQEGLRQVKAQVQMRQIKSDYMSDAYAAGDAKQYNQRENQFDQVMTPDAASIIKMPAGAQRNTIIQNTLKAGNPRDVDALAWAIRTGLLKR